MNFLHSASKSIRRSNVALIGGVFIGAILISVFAHGFVKLFFLTLEVERLNTRLAETTEMLATASGQHAEGLASLGVKTADLSSNLSKTEEKLQGAEQGLASVTNQVGGVQETVGTLQKLSETDPELLQKYSKVYFLNEHYTPERLAALDRKYLYTEARPESVQSQVLPFLKAMLDAAEQQGVTLYAKSAYRSFDEQTALKGSYSVTYGQGANTFSADQGYSEHQLGTTVDFITTGLGGQLDGFGGTNAYAWLLQNAYTYGFILSYPEGNNFYIFEPWHWRFVGVQLATRLKTNGETFYGLDQRILDEYLISIFE